MEHSLIIRGQFYTSGVVRAGVCVSVCMGFVSTCMREVFVIYFASPSKKLTDIVPRPPSASIVPTTVTTLWRLGPTIKECLTSSGHRSTILWVAETLPMHSWR